MRYRKLGIDLLNVLENNQADKTGVIDVKMDGPVYEKQSFFKMLRLLFSSKLDWGAGIVSIDKTAYKEIGALIRSLKFLSSEVEF